MGRETAPFFMGHKVWLYHKDHPPKVFDSDHLPSVEEGWRDSPEAALAVKKVSNEPKRSLRGRKEVLSANDNG